MMRVRRRSALAAILSFPLLPLSGRAAGAGFSAAEHQALTGIIEKGMADQRH